MEQYAKGPDFSIWNNSHNWPAFGASRAADFVLVKASEAVSEDPRFRENWNGAKPYMLRGAYHFFRPRAATLAQADFFCDLLGDDRGEIWPALDVEAVDGLSIQAVAGAAQAWGNAVRKRFGLERLLLYTNYWLAGAMAKHLDQSTWELWISWPLTNTKAVDWPETPQDWKRKPVIWQYTWSMGGLPGVGDKTVDFNYFRGTPETMRSYFGGRPDPTPAPLSLEERVAALEKQARSHGWSV
jgi:lysozyme